MDTYIGSKPEEPSVAAPDLINNIRLKECVLNHSLDDPFTRLAYPIRPTTYRVNGPGPCSRQKSK